jgi:endoglucanase
VQEEVGLRGARILPNQVPADVALILEATACHEVPQNEEEPDQTTVSKLGAGAVISYMDASSIVHPGLFRHVVGVAQREGIPYQFRSSQFAGGNDGGAVHLSREGLPTLAISLPCRYLHSPYSLISLEDYRSALRLARAAFSQLKPEHLLRPD